MPLNNAVKTWQLIPTSCTTGSTSNMQFPDFFPSTAAPDTPYPSLGPSCWYFNAYKPPNCLQPGSLHYIKLASSDTQFKLHFNITHLFHLPTWPSMYTTGGLSYNNNLNTRSKPAFWFYLLTWTSADMLLPREPITSVACQRTSKPNRSSLFYHKW